jgi:hypothetical protein
MRTAAHIPGQALRAAIVATIAATIVYLAFSFLPTWLAWLWTVLAIGAAVYSVSVLLFIIVLTLIHRRERLDLDHRLALLPHNVRANLQETYPRPDKDHLLSLYVDIELKRIRSER